MAFFDSIIGGVAEKFDLGDKAEALLSALLSVISDRKSGGFEGFLDLFKIANAEDLVTSWIGDEDNVAISDEQVKSALGGEVIKSIANKVGISEGKTVSALSYMLPQVVDKLTPDGKLLDNESLLSKIGDFVSGVGGKMADAAETGGDFISGAADKLGGAAKTTFDKSEEIMGSATDAISDAAGTVGDFTKTVAGEDKEAFGDAVKVFGDEPDGNGNSVLKWLLPLLIIVLLLILFFWYFNRGKSNPSADANSVNSSINFKNERNK